MATVKEVRIRFSEEELELYKYISSKRSSSGFLKDLATVEMKREENIINHKDVDLNVLTLNVIKILTETNLLNNLSVNNDEIKGKMENLRVDRNDDFIDDFDDDFDD